MTSDLTLDEKRIAILAMTRFLLGVAITMLGCDSVRAMYVAEKRNCDVDVRYARTRVIIGVASLYLVTFVDALHIVAGSLLLQCMFN